MSRWASALGMLALLACLPAAARDGQAAYAGIGRAATAAEIAAWDIDVRPDFKGLPPGSGSVAAGRAIWDARCAGCHGVFGEANEVFTPVVSGTTADDIRRGRVAALADNRHPQRSMMMKLSQLSTLWDYLRRAMPWDAPKSLSTAEVYALSAYILNLADVVPDDFVLSDRNIADVQQRLPNRNGMTTRHGMWDVGGKPDVRNPACMRDCGDAVRITSTLPAHARDAHGDLAQQQRGIGPVRGIGAADAAP